MDRAPVRAKTSVLASVGLERDAQAHHASLQLGHERSPRVAQRAIVQEIMQGVMDGKELRRPAKK